MDATIKRLQALFYWKSLNSDVRDFINKCDTCQRNKYDASTYPRLLRSLPIPEGVWTNVCIDFIEGLPKVKSEEVILVVVDRQSKSAHFMSLQHPYIAQIVVQFFMDHIFKLHGLPPTLTSICVLVWVVNIGHFSDPTHGGFLRGAIHYFKIAVALAVAAIPEGLPAVVTTCLALGTNDKTGTLTTNMMSVSKICVLHSLNNGPVASEYVVSGTTYAPEGFIFDSLRAQLEIPSQFPCLLHLAMCSALCNESVIQYNPDKRIYEKIGESTEVALRLLAEKIGLPGFDTMPSALNMLSKHERASYCNRYWESQFKKVSVLEFSRDRKMMSVLCSRKQMDIMFSKGAPESILSRCTNILCNDDGSTVPLSAHIRAQLEAKYSSFAGKETLRCLALALKRMPMGQQSLSFDDENELLLVNNCCSPFVNNCCSYFNNCG
ncbi:Calcium-transporting ATPase 3, endoplasmic reticulum-type [Capsicum baccatum]|uniref:Calcium-transporting ATPase 3, endoplasmic reticulum-type n=1 Tax=Capsicum baccatum TaxID=33114 RepID=A0A2G2V9W5_CAPBA|nr:Calcium-transporting ATPase 3, endoplasmic reticulum-type [Capsicum baccatum]